MGLISSVFVVFFRLLVSAVTGAKYSRTGRREIKFRNDNSKRQACIWDILLPIGVTDAREMMYIFDVYAIDGI